MQMNTQQQKQNQVQALNPTFRTCSGSKGAEVQVMGTADTLTQNILNLQSLCKRLYTCPTTFHFLLFPALWSISQTPGKQWDFFFMFMHVLLTLQLLPHQSSFL